MAATPPLRSAIRTPPAPLYGTKYDSYEPYTIRKSTRFTAQRAARTPSPTRQHFHSLTKSSSKSGRSSVATQAANLHSPPSSTQTSPQARTRRTTRSAPENKTPIKIGKERHQRLEQAKSSDQMLMSNPNNPATTMLPTPAKTPRKKEAHTAVTTTARVLFPNRPDTVEDAMPTPHKRKSKRHVGFSLNGLAEEDDASSDGRIEIYTDSKDKLPEIDEGEDNPFYEKSSNASPSKHRSTKRRKASDENEHNEEVQDALARNEGMVYVFRGKKIFRKFAVLPEDPASSSLDPHFGATMPADRGSENLPRSKHFTRSSIKPRLLFPSAKIEEPEVDNTDEEAITDIEERHPEHGGITELLLDTEEEPLVTPVKVSFTPSTPPTTGHATRASTKKSAIDNFPLAPEPVEMGANVKVKKGRTSSPFDGWKRVKPGVEAATKGKKRAAEATEEPGESSKRFRGRVV